MIHELNHLGIVVNDLAESTDFYTRLFGAEKVWEAKVEATGMELTYLQLAQGLIELIALPDKTLPTGTNHLGFYSDDLDADVARLVAAGATQVLAPRISGSGVGRQAIVLDPDGVRIELLQRDLPLRSGTVAHPHIRAIDHFALQSSDHDRSLAFYQGMLEMQIAKQIPIPQLETTLTYLHHGEDVVEVLPFVHGGARLHHIALVVDDVAAAVEHLLSVGGKLSAPAAPAAGGVGSVAAVTDPDGVVIEFIDRPRVLAV